MASAQTKTEVRSGFIGTPPGLSQLSNSAEKWRFPAIIFEEKSRHQLMGSRGDLSRNVTAASGDSHYS
jgi:hypothetical protein